MHTDFDFSLKSCVVGCIHGQHISSRTNRINRCFGHYIVGLISENVHIACIFTDEGCCIVAETSVSNYLKYYSVGVQANIPWALTFAHCF